MRRTYQTSSGLPLDKEKNAIKELKLGYLNLADGFFPQAEMNFKMVLMFDEICADAYWGLMLAKLALKNEDELLTNPTANIEATSLEECQKALEFADDNLRNIYQSLLENINKINEGEKY